MTPWALARVKPFRGLVALHTRGIATEIDEADRKALLRRIGYKL